MNLNKKMTYLDNAATTNKKPFCVIKAFNHAIKKLNANSGRGGHFLSIKASEKVFETRYNLNRFFGGYGENFCVFVENCTEALNLAILGSSLENCHVMATKHEHNSVLRPLTHLKNTKNVEVDFITPKNIHNVEVADFEQKINAHTQMIVVSHVSNLIGSISNLSEIGKFCEKRGIIFVVDAAQSNGHLEIDMKKMHIDFLAIASHKGMFGVAGVSALLFNPKFTPKPIKFGGTGTNSKSLTQNFESPEVFESGTKSLSSIMALNAGTKFVEKKLEKIKKKTKSLTEYLIENLKPYAKVYSKNLNGVIAFNVKNLPSTYVAGKLSDEGICVRAGLHCAPLAHEMLGTTVEGAVRVSVSFFTTKKQVKKLIFAIKKIFED